MNIIVAFAKSEDAQNFKSILSRGGFDGVVTCTSGVQALSAMDDLGSGVIICGYRLSDMLYSELAQDLPGYFQMLMIASADKAPAEISASFVKVFFRHAFVRIHIVPDFRRDEVAFLVFVPGVHHAVVLHDGVMVSFSGVDHVATVIALVILPGCPPFRRDCLRHFCTGPFLAS